MPIGQWNFGPDEHGGQRLADIPPDAIEAPDEDIAPFLIPLDGFLHAILRAVQRDDARDLQRLKDPVVEITFDLGQRANDFSVADTDPYTPAWHVIGLGQGVKLHSDI